MSLVLRHRWAGLYRPPARINRIMNRNIRRRCRRGLLVAALGWVVGLCFGLIPEPARADLSLETETARVLAPGRLEVSGAVEIQKSPTGRERALPLAFEYGLKHNSELLVEPVLYTAILPKTGTQARGLGDLEVTLTHVLKPETVARPAFAVAGEVKVATARDRLIGTGKTDYTAYLILSKRNGKFDTHGNVGYTLIGSPSGAHLKNIFNIAVASEYTLSRKFDLTSEILANTSSVGGNAEVVPPAGGGGGEGPDSVARRSRVGSLTRNATVVIPEATGGELVGTFGFRYRPQPNKVIFMNVSYDNNRAVLLRTGLTLGF